MFPFQQETFGRRLMNIKRRFQSSIRLVTIPAGATVKVADQASNRVYLGFGLTAAAAGHFLRPSELITSSGYSVGNTTNGLLEFKIDIHYDLLLLTWVCQNTTGVGSSLMVVETFYKGG